MSSTTKQVCGVVECSSTQGDVSGHPAERILPVAISLMGTLVKVQTKQNEIFEGVFRAFSTQFEIALEVAHQLIPGREEDLPRHNMVHEKLIFKLEDIVSLEGTPDLEAVVKTGFATDTEISGVRNGADDRLRPLQPWEPDVNDDEMRLSPENNGPLSDGWKVDDMFLVNEKRFAIKSDYDERLYSTAEFSIDPNNEADQEKARRASEIAREIERNPASQRAAELENEDEERDIVVRSSGSSANNSVATTPTSTTASGIPSKDRYIHGNKRNTGAGDRGGRGPRRGGGAYPPGGGRNQGDMRMAPRGGPGGREYGDGYPVGGTYRPHRPYNQHQPHSLAHTSHERSPSGAGSADWRKRHDMREGFAGQQSSMPPQTSVVPTGPGPRPIPPLMAPPRQGMDGPAANGNRRNAKLEDGLRKFSKDFQLASESLGGGVPPSGPTAGAPVGPNSTGSRMPPPLPSPGQVPSAHHQQRRSPEGQPGPGYGHQHQPPPVSHHQPQKHPQGPPAQAQQLPPQVVRTDMPPRPMVGNEALYQSQQLQHQLPPTDYANAAQQQHHIHQSMGGQSAQAGGPKMPMSGPGRQGGHVMGSTAQPPPHPPPATMAQSPAQTPHQEQHASVQMHDQRNNESTNESIKKSKLNPDAAEFHPQFLRQAPSTGPPVPQNPPMSNYPIAVQSPPQSATLQSQNSGPAMYGSIAMAGPGYIGTATNAYPTQQTHSSTMSVHMVPTGTPVYTIQASQQPALALISNNSAYRPRAAVTAPPQQAVVAATGQPIMAGQYPQASPLVYYNHPGQQSSAQIPTGQASGPYQPNAYVINRMLPPQYIVPQAHGNGDHSQQPQYYVSPAVQVGIGSYPQAASVPAISVAPGMQQSSGPATMYNQQQHQQQPQQPQQQGNGNNGHSQTPPTSQQNLSPAAGPAQGPTAAPTPGASHPPPSNSVTASGTGPVNATVIYPQSAPTPQSPQYQTAPPYPGAPPPFVVFQPGGYMATAATATPQLYNNQAGLPPGAAVHIHGTAPVQHGYQPAQAHFVAPEYYAAFAAAQQAALAAHQQGYHQPVLRSSSVPAFGPPNVASGQGAQPVSHTNNHA